MKIKYLILDMGRVLIEPTTGHWQITPAVVNTISDKDFDYMKLASAMKENGNILDKKCCTLEEEREIVYEYYKKSFEDIEYDITEDKLNKIVKNFVYEDGKYYLYDDVREQLERLSKKYTVIMLSDNWPCSLVFLDRHDIRKYFDKIYISSVYGVRKRDGVFFDYPINEYDIKPGEALFIDDNEGLLDIGVQKGLEVCLMDRLGKVNESKYKIIHSLSDID